MGIASSIEDFASWLYGAPTVENEPPRASAALVNSVHYLEAWLVHTNAALDNANQRISALETEVSFLRRRLGEA